MKDSLKIAIAGATGYTGLQLTKILLKHPKVKISYLCAQKFFQPATPACIAVHLYSFDALRKICDGHIFPGRCNPKQRKNLFASPTRFGLYFGKLG